MGEGRKEFKSICCLTVTLSSQTYCIYIPTSVFICQIVLKEFGEVHKGVMDKGQREDQCSCLNTLT